MRTYKRIPIEYRSDKKIKGGRIGKCIICDNLKQLRLSHIIPKWLYQPLKTEGGIINDFKSLDVHTINDQDGAKQYLLCNECENFMSISENYIRTLMLGNEKSLLKIGVEIKNHLFYNLNYELILRYLLGSAIRIHFATCAPYHNCSLRDKDLSIIKSELLSPKNNDLKFICFATKYHPNTQLEIDSNAIIHVDLGYLDSKNIPYLTILGCGWEWSLIVDRDLKLNYDDLLKSRIRIDSPYKTLEGNILDHRYLKFILSSNNK